MGMAGELVRQMGQAFGCAPSDLLAGIAPCAGPSKYQVGEEVRRIFAARLEDGDSFLRKIEGKLYLDLRAANVAQLVSAGVRPQRIHVADECTISDNRFYSHRRDDPNTGRFAMIAGLRS